MGLVLCVRGQNLHLALTPAWMEHPRGAVCYLLMMIAKPTNLFLDGAGQSKTSGDSF
jgi:hypothetical protein